MESKSQASIFVTIACYFSKISFNYPNHFAFLTKTDKSGAKEKKPILKMIYTRICLIENKYNVLKYKTFVIFESIEAVCGRFWNRAHDHIRKSCMQ